MEQTGWNSIRAKFMGETRKPIIYRTNISIRLEGEVSAVDSAIMNELVDSLRIIIPTRSFSFTANSANLILKFSSNPKIGKGTSTIAIGKEIQFTELTMGLIPAMSREARKKILYYYFYRSLAHFSPSKYGTTTINGCVFDEVENNSGNINYSPVDAFILNKLYADNFEEQYSNYFIKHNSYKRYLIEMYQKELEVAFLLLGLIISAILLSILITRGIFKPHHWNWLEFNKQGSFLILIGCIYALFISLSDLDFKMGDMENILNLFFKSIVAVNLIYFIEHNIIRGYNPGLSKIIISFTTTLVILIIVAFPYDHSPLRFKNNIVVEPNIFYQLELRYKLLLPYIFIVSLTRILFIFINDRYKSIINEKDVELAKVNELHKHAELQSLQAKINPHFLYNALNSIASLATTDAKKTEQMALGLSDFFKYSINREQKQLNSLSEELNAIRTYLEIEKVRFGERLSFEIVCSEELLDIQIPQLLLQPLVENAIKHGLSQITVNGLIRISVSREEKQLKIRIYDNGPAFSEGPLSGYGIQNTQERITLLYGGKASINWHNGDEKYIEINLPLEA